MHPKHLTCEAICDVYLPLIRLAQQDAHDPLVRVLGDAVVVIYNAQEH